MKSAPSTLPPSLRARALWAALAALAAIAAATAIVAPGSAGAQAPTCFGRAATIVARPGVVTYGTSGADVIVGTWGPDVIRGHGGADYICALGGDDVVYAGYGSDTVDLGPGRDIARGGPGRDLLYGGSGSDLIRGRGGADTIRAQGGIDECYGGKGRDRLHSCNEPPEQRLSAAENQMVGLVQDLRAQRGAGPLAVSVDMSEVARSWSERLPDGFAHNPSVGAQIPSGWRAWGENIAYNVSVTAAFDALANSPGHLSNMVHDDYTHVGVGVHVEDGLVYVTQVFARY